MTSRRSHGLHRVVLATRATDDEVHVADVDPRHQGSLASEQVGDEQRTRLSRVFAKLDQAPSESAPVEQVLAGQTVKFLVKDDGDHYFQIPRERGQGIGRVVQAIRRRVGA